MDFIFTFRSSQLDYSNDIFPGLEMLSNFTLPKMLQSQFIHYILKSPHVLLQVFHISQKKSLRFEPNEG